MKALLCDGDKEKLAIVQGFSLQLAMESSLVTKSAPELSMAHLERAIELAETQSRLARLMNVHPQAIQGWRKTGQIPADRVLDIARAVVFQVTPHQLRPDLYPHPDDGLPAERRSQVAA